MESRHKLFQDARAELRQGDFDFNSPDLDPGPLRGAWGGQAEGAGPPPLPGAAPPVLLFPGPSTFSPADTSWTFNWSQYQIEGVNQRTFKGISVLFFSFDS